VKLKGKDETALQLTDTDKNIASLKSLIVDLTAQVESLDLKVTELDRKARSAVASKNRLTAISSLRSKKLYETMYQRRSETLAQIEGVYTKIEEAVDQVEIVKVMQSSTQVLKGLNQQIGSVETVEEMLDQLKTEMTKLDDVGAMIGEAGPVVDEGATDEELEALEKEDQKEKDLRAAKETKQRLEELESMPSLKIGSPAQPVGDKDTATPEASDKQPDSEIGSTSQDKVEDDAGKSRLTPQMEAMAV
jgi:charged multivesicular body protein 7